MRNTTTIFKLQGKVQHYAWGGTTFIPSLLRESNPGQQPFAEYWMGAHDNVPANVVLPNGSMQPLNEFIKGNAAHLLGEPVFKKFGRLPYLFKVLDVKDMLSIQVHPAKLAAEKEFADENKKGTPLSAPDRNYKDDNHKPELMLALSEFWLLHGFKSPEILTAILNNTKELQFLLPLFHKADYAALYSSVMKMEQAEVNRLLQPLMERILPLYGQGKLTKDMEDFWAARAVKTFCTDGNLDRGIFSIYFFNLVHLQPGDAVFQDAGILHAYLEGQNMEIMANSDNVLRGGLTNKHVDVNELMKHVRFEPVIPNILKGTTGSVQQEKVFDTPAADFELRQVELKKEESVTLSAFTSDIFFIYKGSIVAESENDQLELVGGEAMLAIAGASVQLTARENAVIFRATVPAALP
jgi:mannose-6-phosphate isomerase